MNPPGRVFVHCLTCDMKYHYRRVTRPIVRHVGMTARMTIRGYEAVSKLVRVEEILATSSTKRPVKVHKVNLCPACEGEVVFHVGSVVVGCRKKDGTELSCTRCQFVGWACSDNQDITLRSQEIKNPVPMREIDESHPIAKASSA